MSKYILKAGAVDNPVDNYVRPLVSLTIYGSLPSMKNQRRLVLNRKTRAPMLIKSKQCIEYEKEFMAQVPSDLRYGYCGPVSLIAKVYYPSRRNDLDIEFLKDLLQKSNLIANDRQVVHQEARKDLDPVRPRVYFSIYPTSDPTRIRTTLPRKPRSPGGGTPIRGHGRSRLTGQD